MGWFVSTHQHSEVDPIRGATGTSLSLPLSLSWTRGRSDLPISCRELRCLLLLRLVIDRFTGERRTEQIFVALIGDSSFT